VTDVFVRCVGHPCRCLHMLQLRLVCGCSCWLPRTDAAKEMAGVVHLEENAPRRVLSLPSQQHLFSMDATPVIVQLQKLKVDC
jgi:hypothetical protein